MGHALEVDGDKGTRSTATIAINKQLQQARTQHDILELLSREESIGGKGLQLDPYCIIDLQGYDS